MDRILLLMIDFMFMVLKGLINIGNNAKTNFNEDSNPTREIYIHNLLCDQGRRLS